MSTENGKTVRVFFLYKLYKHKGERFKMTNTEKMETLNTNTAYDLLLPQNKVEGLDPNKLLTKFENDNGEASIQMRAEAAIQWFYTVHPNGAMNHDFNILDGQRAVVTASVYRNVDDVRPAATATVSKYYSEKDVHGINYIQNAVTGAYKKALAYLGFTAPINAVEVEGIEVVHQDNIPTAPEDGVRLLPQRPIAPVIKNSKNIDNVPVEKPKAEKKPEKKAAIPTAPTPAPIPPVSGPIRTVAWFKAQAIPRNLEEGYLVLCPCGSSKGKSLKELVDTFEVNKLKYFHRKTITPGTNETCPAFAKAIEFYFDENGIDYDDDYQKAGVTKEN